MVKTIISNEPTRDNLQQFMEAIKGKCGIEQVKDEKGKEIENKWIMGINIADLERRITALEEKK